ncbi:VENN motif pre-toxin domain-containing protein [Neisseria arctica]|uniref:VENN motif pre-toxin domain-containing protein n=1 Tax=Neisseria arctica TaxID=1470200 RepID=UPI001F201AA0|nr:VENN motif pre-toxin domain-containing protein [Neisseria arctica]UOO87150.1 VENN motif pre-toxin domain-containing protein [Neisseria arctica]
MGATLAYINGSSPASGGSAAVAAEKAAQYLAQQYDDGQTARDPVTGEFNANLLPEHIKDEIKSTTGVIASIVGATGDGGSALGAQIGGVIGQNAVENNYLSLKDVNDLRAELKRAKTDEEKERIIEKYRKKGEKQSQALRELCRSKGNECHLNAIADLRNTNQAAATIINNGLLFSLTESGRTDLSAWGLALDSNLPDLTYHEDQLTDGAKLLDTGVKLSPVVGAAISGAAIKATSSKTLTTLQRGNQIAKPSPVDGEMAAVPQKVTLGAKRAQVYSQNWKEADLDETIRKFVGSNPKIYFTPKGKAIYEGKNGIQIVQDIAGGYFRILDTKISGKRNYLDLNGTVPNNKIISTGKQAGRTTAEYNEVTHFKIKN